MEKEWKSIHSNITALVAMNHILDVSDDIIVAGEYLIDKVRDGTLDSEGWALPAINCNTVKDMREIAAEFFAGDIVDLFDKDNRGE